MPALVRALADRQAAEADIRASSAIAEPHPRDDAERIVMLERSVEHTTHQNQQRHDAATPYLSPAQLARYDEMNRLQLEKTRNDLRTARATQGSSNAAPRSPDRPLSPLARGLLTDLRAPEREDLNMRRVIAAMMGFALLGAAGCSLMRPDSPSTPKVELTGTWLAEDIDGAGVVDTAQSTLQFGTDGRVNGRGGCNRYGGSVKVEGASILMSELFSTRMACAPALTDQETRFMAALQAVRSYRMEDAKLVLVDATGKPRLRFARE